MKRPLEWLPTYYKKCGQGYLILGVIKGQVCDDIIYFVNLVADDPSVIIYQKTVV